MPNWRPMIEIICHSNSNQQTYYINNRAFKGLVVALANFRLRLIQGHKIENARYWQIYNKVGLQAIANAQNCNLIDK